ncbi:MAG TPA: type IV pilus secretin PilQ [Thermoanaerobaculia bacterium]|jgi:type IV pilus assembly protein PilQ|nr:type IV pilus secretin PilQ [Thermoanaerobaculia bacterium]
MSRAKRILLIGGVLLVCVGTADARLWRSRKAEKPAATAAVPGAVVLSAVEVDGSRVVLRTSGAPAYTSYSPSPGVFVIDLTGTSRDAAAVVPSTLPPAVASISADEVVEMGTRLTRVTFRFSDTIIPETAASENSVVVTVPASSIPIENVASTVDVLPAVVPLAQTESQPEPAIIETPAPIAEAEIVEEPIAVAEEAVLPRARAVKRIGATKANGEVEVRISADGELKYKAFRLDDPARLVIDLDGVKNAAVKSNVDVDDDLVKRVRVAQFQPTVARVVVDLAHKTEWQIQPAGDTLRVTFPATATDIVETPAPMTPAPVPVKIAAVEPAPAPQPPAPQPAQAAPVRKPIVIEEVPASVPTIAENASTWKMPEPAPSKPAWNPPQASRGARKVINAPADQEPPVRPTDDVFATPQPATQPQTLSGPRTLSGGPRVFNGEPLSLNLKDADIKDVVRTFAELTGLNIAVDPGVTGSVTVDFVDVPWDQALDLILRQNNLTYVLEGNVMRIGFLDRLAAEVQAARALAEAERLNVPLTTLSFKLSYARANDVASLLRGIASARAQIIVDARTNQLVVSEVPVYMQTMQNLIATIDIPTRQVMIEARIVESARTFAQEWGIDWDFGGTLDPALGTGTGLVFPNRVGFRGGPFTFGGAAAPILTLNFLDVLGVFDLDVTLRAAETAGYIKVISAPRVTTQDNTPAEIQSGFQIPYQTRINFTTTVTYLDATLRLSVTPQITEAGTVIMEIAVQKNEPATGLAFEGAAGTPLTTRQARTRLMVRDGGTAVIAGIFTTRDSRGQSRVPILHNIPILGELFKTHNVDTTHDELLIFITPRIVRG